ncbi:MAG: hypothetical protein Q9162_004940 [Coniocarpon cinnabarinum]
MASSSNPLISSTKTSDSRLSVQLHPLVLLNISDYITRHTLRESKDPIVGAVLGSQNGRDITMEVAFECKTDKDNDGAVIMDAGWFHDRLQQFRDVYKQPSLDLVGWFTLAPSSGPQHEHLAIHHQLAEAYNESILLLAFYPSSLQEGSRTGGDKLPITIFEPVFEAGSDDGDKNMDAPGEVQNLVLRFKELPFTIETGDAEMIGVDFVARGAANATAIPQTADAATGAEVPKGKGKERADDAENEDAQANYLTTDEEDLLATLTAKANAIRMLRQRILLLKKYLESLPPCYLNDASIKTMEPHERISHPILRSIASLLARLPLLVPSTPSSTSLQTDTYEQTQKPSTVFEEESAAQASDVALVSLLGTLGSTLQDADKMSKKAQIYESDLIKKRPSGGRNQAFYDPIQDSPFDMDGNGDYGMPVNG